MREELYYTNFSGQIHFVHEHVPNKVKDIPIVFLNPVFDEKKRSQRFYAETARNLCANGSPVIRFDYYGTGDSEGQLFDLDLRNISDVVKALIIQVKEKYSVKKVNILGLRFGADIALEIASDKDSFINSIILIEPIVIGKCYLSEQRSRRKMFFKLNNMINIQEQIKIDEKIYEDHQGYPISIDNLDFLNKLDSTQIKIKNSNIFLIKLNTISSKKAIAVLFEKLEENNEVRLLHNNCDDFWANLEPIDTIKLSKEIGIETLSCKL